MVGIFFCFFFLETIGFTKISFIFVSSNTEKHRKMKTKWEQKEQVQKLIAKINDRIFDLQTLKGGWIMTNKVFRIMLQEHPELSDEFDILKNRKESLKRLLWKLP